MNKNLFDDDFIDVDETELLTGDDNLKIQIPDTLIKKDEEEEEKKEDTSTKNNKSSKKDNKIKTFDKEDDLIDIDDDYLEDSENDEQLEDEEKDDNSNDDSEKSDVNEFALFGTSLVEKGFFPDIDENEIAQISNEDELSDLLAKQLNTTFGQWKNQYRQNLIVNLVNEGYISQEQTKIGSVSFTEDQIRENLDIAKEDIIKE